MSDDSDARHYDDSAIKQLAKRQLAGERLPADVTEKLTRSDIRAFAAHLPPPQTLNILATAQGAILTANSKQLAKNERDKIVAVLRQHLADVEAGRGIGSPIRPSIDLKDAAAGSPTSDYPSRVLALTISPMLQAEFRKFAAKHLRQVIANLESEKFDHLGVCDSVGVVSRATKRGQLQLMTGSKK